MEDGRHAMLTQSTLERFQRCKVAITKVPGVLLGMMSLDNVERNDLASLALAQHRHDPVPYESLAANDGKHFAHRQISRSAE